MEMKKLEDVLNSFKNNGYNIESKSLDDEYEFWDICTELMVKIEELRMKYLNEKSISKFSVKDKKDFYSRNSAIDDLNEELNCLYNINGEITTGNNPIEYTKRISIVTEICNNAAHILETFNKVNGKKNNYLVTTQKEFYAIKNVGISKLIDSVLGREKDGIIVGTTRDESKYENSSVFVVDIPGTGQVSWHFKTEELDLYTKEKILDYQYPFKVQKDSKTEDITRNTSLLIGSADKFLNIHNKIDINIPNDKEHELKMALNIYYEIKNLEHDKKEFNDGILDEDPDEKVYRRLKKSCIKHGIPSKKVFDMLLDKMVDDVFDGIKYDKEELREWRNEISGREQIDS